MTREEALRTAAARWGGVHVVDGEGRPTEDPGRLARAWDVVPEAFPREMLERLRRAFDVRS